jgi:mannosyltransferase OCH1-like enzyme
MDSVIIAPVPPSNHIPRTVHQFWDTGTPPAPVEALMTTWRTLNPDWAYTLWSHRAALEFIELNYGSRLRDAFLQCAFAAMQADVARYAILYKVGGVYADADLSCLKPMDEVLAANALAMTFQGWNGAWRNDLMALAAGHPMMAEILEKVVANIEVRSSNNLWLVTGPGATTPIIEKHQALPTSNLQTFRFDEMKSKVIGFHHSLDYRLEGRHWSEAQQRTSIYRDLEK